MIKELKARYVRVPNKHIAKAVLEMFAEAGVGWGSSGRCSDDYPTEQYGDQACLAYQYDAVNDWYNVSPIRCWEDSGYEEISIEELAKVLAKKPTYKVGQWFRHFYCGSTEYYVLSNLGSKRVGLLCTTGVRYTNPVEVNDPFNITSEELGVIFGSGGYEGFIPVDVEIKERSKR